MLLGARVRSTDADELYRIARDRGTDVSKMTRGFYRQVLKEAKAPGYS